MFAIAISNLMGIRIRLTSTNQRDLEEFLGSHMSLSFWFRDFVFYAHSHGDDKKEIVSFFARKPTMSEQKVGLSTAAFYLNISEKLWLQFIPAREKRFPTITQWDLCTVFQR